MDNTTGLIRMEKLSALQLIRKRRTPVAQYEYKRKDKKTTVSCVKFSPFNDKDIFVADVDEGFCVLKNAIPSSATKPEPSKKATKSAASKEERSDSSSDKDEDEDEESRSVSKGAFLDDEAEDDGDTRMSADIGEIKRKYGFGDDTTGKLEDFGFSVSDEPPVRGSASPTHGFEPSVSHAAPPPPEVIAYKPPTIPSFFVSGASPDHLTQRYLISFHDLSIHPTIVLDNGTTEYVLADLSDQAVALASKAEEKGEQSEMLVIHISSWDSESRRWSTKLPLKENALDVLVSRELICLVTEKRNVRVFSLTGTQRHIISHPSPILTTACFGNFIAICSITGGDYYEKGKDHQPHFQHTVSVYDVSSRNWYRKKNTVTTVNVPVAKKEQLLWLSYTNCGQLDSDKSKLEQELFLNELRQSEAVSTGLSSELTELASGHLQSLVKLFALACKSERDGRAAELAGLVASAKGIQMMCNYAAKLKKSTLADKVAAKGRENVSSNESTSTSYDTMHEDPAPRRISMKRKSSLAQQRPLFMEDDSVTSTVSGANSDEEVEASQPQDASCSQANESMLNDSTVVPMQKISRNPFKRSPSASLDTSSCFYADSMPSSANRKRNREEERI
ncbi:hypothetical protein OESDEN_13709 [Oesophagostomum dentatum]|uniref:Uncharacterized protein n=1 Tax=Oesophagostomum dentatum TaxID=61180 RepID=A0A0B1SNM1_OESDE|nr:hypothetical protein OESDEN_13709 [Oesophagostomum dentatum]